MILVFSITFVIGLVGGTIISLQYSQSFYVCLDFPEFSAIECLRYSRKIMKGSKGRRFLSGCKLYPALSAGAAYLRDWSAVCDSICEYCIR